MKTRYIVDIADFDAYYSHKDEYIGRIIEHTNLMTHPLNREWLSGEVKIKGDEYEYFFAGIKIGEVDF